MSADCLYCPGIEDNTEHIFSSTVTGGPKDKARPLVADIGRIAPDNIVEAMLKEKDVWNHAAHYVEDVLRV